MSDDEGDEVSAPGRRPPPRKSRFKKGQSGNPAGRPKGAVSLAKLTTTFALRKLTISVNGDSEQKTRLEITILKLIALAADGKATAIEELLRLRNKASPPEISGGLLVVPAPMSLEEYIAKVEEENRNKVAPDTSIDLDADDLFQAPEREATALDHALKAHRQKYGR
jgi:hypothetical protein